MQLSPTTKNAYQLVHEGVLALQKATKNGMRVDVEYCRQKIDTLSTAIEKHRERFWKTEVGRVWKNIYREKRNINASLQIQKVLFDELGIKPIKFTDTGKPAVDLDVLINLAETRLKEIRHILKIRKYTKTRDYLKGILREQVNGILHPFFLLHLVRTYRSSSANINFHNQPKRDAELKKLVRSAIYPRLGHQFGGGDFSGIEVRIACCLTKDEKLIYDTIHGDMHRDMAQEIYMLDSIDKHDPGENNLRQGGKNGFVFPQFYGDYYGNCAPNLLEWARISTLKDGTPALEHLQNKGLLQLGRHGEIKNTDKFVQHVKKIEDDFWNVRYKTYTSWKKAQINFYQRKGYIISPTGFKFSGVMDRKQVCNYAIQGSAFHCLLWSFIEMTKRLEEGQWDSMLVGQIHDEMVADICPTEAKGFFQLMQQITCIELPKVWPWIIVPFELEFARGSIDGSWYTVKDYTLE